MCHWVRKESMQTHRPVINCGQYQVLHVHIFQILFLFNNCVKHQCYCCFCRKLWAPKEIILSWATVKEGHVWSEGVSQVTCGWALLSWGWLNPCPAMEAVNWFLVLLCLGAWFLLSLWNSISTHEFCSFSPSDSLPHPAGGEWASGRVVLCCWQGLNLDPGQWNVWRTPANSATDVLITSDQVIACTIMELRTCF